MVAETEVALKAVDRLEITTPVDNSIDVFLSSTGEVRRPQIPASLPRGERKALASEHGDSALVRLQTTAPSATLLFDASVSTDVLIYSMDVREMQLPRELLE